MWLNDGVFLAAMLLAIAVHEFGHFGVAQAFGLPVPGIDLGRGDGRGWVICAERPRITIRWSFPFTGYTDIPGEEQLPSVHLMVLAAAGPIAQALVLILPWALHGVPHLWLIPLWVLCLCYALSNFHPRSVLLTGELHLNDGGLIWLAIKRLSQRSFSEKDLHMFKVRLQSKPGLINGIALSTAVLCTILAVTVWANWFAYANSVYDLAAAEKDWFSSQVRTAITLGLFAMIMIALVRIFQMRTRSKEPAILEKR